MSVAVFIFPKINQFYKETVTHHLEQTQPFLVIYPFISGSRIDNENCYIQRKGMDFFFF